MHFITVVDRVILDTKVYLNINAITKVNLRPNDEGLYQVNTGGNELILVNKEDCQRILDEIKKYNGRP